MNLKTDKAAFNVSLRNACLAIAIFFLVSMLLGILVRPSYLTYSSSLVGFILQLLGNLGLLFGVLWSNHWLVLIWLINALLFFISWPIAVLGVIFNYGDYRYAGYFDNIILNLVVYVLMLLFMAYCTRLVYSYFDQLRNSKSNPLHAVVI